MSKDYDSITIEVVNQLFEDLFGICKGWKAAVGDDEDIGRCKRQWLLAFKENNITSIEQLRKGLVGMRSRELPFLPSPGEFLALCKTTPEDIGAPPLDQAYQEACEKSHPCYGVKTWSHEAVKMAYLKSDPFTLRTQPASTTKPIFKKNYIECCEDLAEGKALNRLEEHKARTFTQVEMHWITLYQYYTEGFKREIDFPSKEIFEQARELYHEWIKGQKS